MVERDFAVSGMHCGACVALITEEVSEVPGVDSVTVDLAAGRATVRYDPAQVTDESIVRAIRDAGYEASAP
jgi:copper ion binding protein